LISPPFKGELKKIIQGRVRFFALRPTFQMLGYGEAAASALDKWYGKSWRDRPELVEGLTTNGLTCPALSW